MWVFNKSTPRSLSICHYAEKEVPDAVTQKSNPQTWIKNNYIRTNLLYVWCLWVREQTVFLISKFILLVDVSLEVSEDKWFNQSFARRCYVLVVRLFWNSELSRSVCVNWWALLCCQIIPIAMSTPAPEKNADRLSTKPRKLERRRTKEKMEEVETAQTRFAKCIMNARASNSWRYPLGLS